MSLMLDMLYSLQTFTPLWWGSLVILGLCIGSFLNVVIHRLPIMLKNNKHHEFNLCIPRSYCPHCHHSLKWHDNIPIFSWFLLKAQCRHCQNKISLRYPMIELATVALTLFISMIIPAGYTLLAALVFTWVLIALTAIDIEHLLLPDNLTLSLLWGGLIFHLFDQTLALSDAVIGAVGGYLVLWCLYWAFWLTTHREALGYGDFKLLAALGAWLGWMELPALLLIASLAGSSFTFIAHLLRNRPLSAPLPFGPFLALAGWLLFLHHYHAINEDNILSFHVTPSFIGKISQ
ncbi:prepilin peptidase [Yersinia entomophaga]|nr:prepilin peptidase [Yersinia entomophaga]